MPRYEECIGHKAGKPNLSLKGYTSVIFAFSSFGYRGLIQLLALKDIYAIQAWAPNKMKGGSTWSRPLIYVTPSTLCGNLQIIDGKAIRISQTDRAAGITSGVSYIWRLADANQMIAYCRLLFWLCSVSKNGCVGRAFDFTSLNGSALLVITLDSIRPERQTSEKH